MPSENTEIVRRFFEANRSDDIEGAIEANTVLTDPGFEFTPVMAAVQPQTYRGPEGFRRYIEEMADSWQEWRMEVEEVFDVDPNTVLATFYSHLIGKDSGARVKSLRAVVVVLSDRKVLRANVYPSPEEAREAVELRD
jgi:ketosteroid isomerase-like protein